MANHRREQTYPQQQSQAPFQIRVGLSICTPSSLSPYKFYWAHLNFVYCCPSHSPWPGFFSLVLVDESFHLSSLVAHTSTLGLFFSTNSFDNLQIFHHKWRYRVPDHIFHRYEFDKPCLFHFKDEQFHICILSNLMIPFGRAVLPLLCWLTRLKSGTSKGWRQVSHFTLLTLTLHSVARTRPDVLEFWSRYTSFETGTSIALSFPNEITKKVSFKKISPTNAPAHSLAKQDWQAGVSW